MQSPIQQSIEDIEWQKQLAIDEKRTALKSKLYAIDAAANRHWKKTGRDTCWQLVASAENNATDTMHETCGTVDSLAYYEIWFSSLQCLACDARGGLARADINFFRKHGVTW